MKYLTLKEHALRSMCRQCINEQYGLSLKPKHCYYMPYPNKCRCCDQVRNIVVDVRPITRLRIRLTKTSPNAVETPNKD